MAILLVKNPAGANEVFRTLAAADGEGELDVWMVLNDRIADGRDISWIWDADFETLAPRAGAGGLLGDARRGAGAAAEVRGRRPAAARGDPRARARLRPRAGREATERPLYALPTYTALLELRDVLADRGYAPPFWE